ncbi:hypothetical protein F4703DRAFT_1737767, partial [Phycomyces blakesleeanus]
MRDPKLERLLYNYNSSLDQVQEVKESISKTQRSEHNIAKRLWKTETIKQTLETKCEINTLLYRRFYEATLIRLEIQTLLDQILWELPSRAIIKHTLPNEWEDQETRKHDGITLIRLLNTLFSTAPLWSSVLKEPTEEQEVGLFEKCVRTWILQVGAVLLDLSLPSERRCLLLHLLQTKSASWAIPLLQYSFHPTAKLPVADMEEYVVAIRMICPLPVWTEDDFLVALDQFGVAQTFCATIQEAFRQPFSKESIDALFNFADELLEALNNIRKESQNRIDNFVSNVVLGYLEVEEKTMYNFLPILPFHGVSIDSLWIITLRLLKIDEYKKPDNFGEQLTLPDMTQFLRFLEANQTQGIFMLGFSFGRYVIEHLNFGTISGSEDLTISKSQPWHNRTMPFLPYEIHEEIAFLLLDACQKYQPLPESDKSSDVLGIVATAMSTYMVTPDQLWTAATSTIIATEFIQWAWKMALKLKLYDCPITTRASDIEKAITPAFLKDALHHHHDAIGMHHALLTYISFLLSSTSRHFLRFETSNGWLKLLLILRRGKPEAVLQVMSDIIPAFVYMHGDDFFNDESLSEFLRQMMDTFWNKQEITGIGLVIGSHAWQGHFIDSVGDLMDENGGGFSYLDLMLHSWLKTIFARKEWMWSDQYVVAIDCIAKIAFSLGRYSLVRSMLSSEHMRLEQNRSQQLLSSPKLAALGGQHRNPLRFIKNIMPDTAYTSLLAGEWTMMSLTANNLMRAPGVEAKSFWFAYEVLVMETIHDQEQRYALANAALDLIKQRKTEPLKPSDYLSIYRWAQHILVLPHNHPLLPLYLQIFFCLYYSSITVGDKTLLYGTYFFSKKQELLHKVRDRTAYLQTYHGQQQPSGEKVAAALRQIYYSMWLWLGNTDLLRPDFDLSTLPTNYSINRLKQCRQPSTPDAWELHQPWNSKTSLWFDLINKKQLQDAFIQFPWEGSEKF